MVLVAKPTQMRDHVRRDRHREDEERVNCFGGYQ